MKHIMDLIELSFKTCLGILEMLKQVQHDDK